MACSRCTHEPALSRILDCLSKRRVRATYTALVRYLGWGNVRTVMIPHAKDERHQWIVASKTGLPTGFPLTPQQKRALQATPLAETASELKAEMLKCTGAE